MENYNPFFEKPKKQPRNWLVVILQSLVILTSLGIVLYLFVITPNQVDGPSMEKTLINGEIVLTNRLVQWIGQTEIGNALGFDYKKYDIVVFQKPGYSEFVKRIIAIPGERVSIRDGSVYVNNQKIIESYLPPTLYTKGGDLIKEGAESLIVPEDSYFLLGDNRNLSNDSRNSGVGFIKREWIKGRVIFRIWPLSAFGIISSN